MGDYFKMFAWTIGGLILVAVVWVALSALGLFGGRYAQPYAEETRRQTYETSRTYQQGTNLAISRYCAEWRTADAEHRTALAQIISETAATYDGPLSADARRCIEETR